MKVEFSKDGVRINSKKIDPFNFKIKGYELSSNIEKNKKDPFEILEALVSIKKDKTKMEKIEAVKSMTKK